MEKVIFLKWGHLNLDYEITHFSQLEFLKKLCSSRSYKDIAAEDNVTQSAVSSRACRLFKQTGARDRFELAIWATKKGIIQL